MATCAILFYDYLLTLPDEVGQVYFPCVFPRPLRPRFVEDQIRLVWEETVGYAHY